MSATNCNSMAGSGIKLHCLLLVFLGLLMSVRANLSPNFYKSTCPNVLSIVKEGVEEAIKDDSRMGASLLRLHFHDCFVNGCDGSVLLDATPSFKSEKQAIPNNGSLRGFEVIDRIKSELEMSCPGVVSCADIVAIAARDSVVQYGGPSWKVGLGRRDSLTANQSAANAFLPPPSLNISGLASNFAQQGLSFKDMVALSGAHTVGFARCTNYRAHIYNDTNIDPTFAKSLQSKCPRSGNDNVLQQLDRQTPFQFDDKYYQNILVKKGLLHSDMALFSGSSRAESLVQKYATNQREFFKDFAKGMVNMGNIKPLTGNNGEIRLNCRKPNC